MEERLSKVPTRIHDQPVLGEALRSGFTIDEDNLPYLFNDAMEWFDSVCVLERCMPGAQTPLLKFDNAQLRLSRWGKAAGLTGGRRIDSLSHPWNSDSKEKAGNIFRDIVRAVEFSRYPFGSESNLMCQYLHNKVQTISNSRRSFYQGSQKDKILISEDGHLVDLTKKLNELIDRLYELFPSLREGLVALAQREYAEFFNVLRMLETVAGDYDLDLRAEVQHTIEKNIHGPGPS